MVHGLRARIDGVIINLPIVTNANGGATSLTLNGRKWLGNVMGGGL